MGNRGETLGDDVLAAFERACHENDLEVAEHLLRALEAMACRADGKKRVEKAYLQVADSIGKRVRH